MCGPQSGCMELPQRFFEPVTNATFGWAWECQGTMEGQRETRSLLFQLRPSAGVKRGVSHLGPGDAVKRRAHGALCWVLQLPQPHAGTGIPSTAKTKSHQIGVGGCRCRSAVESPPRPTKSPGEGPRAVQPARGRPRHPNNVTLRRAAAQAPHAAPGTHRQSCRPQPLPLPSPVPPGELTGQADGAGAPRLVPPWPSPGGRH